MICYFCCFNWTLFPFYISRGLRMVDIEEFHNWFDSMELSMFQNLCMRHIEAAKEKLLNMCVISYYGSDSVNVEHI